MSRLKKFAGVAACTVVVGALAAPAEAQSGPKATTKAVAFRHDDCVDRTVKVTGLDPDVDSDITVSGPDDDYVLDEETASGSSKFNFSFELCADSVEAGRHTIYVEGDEAGHFSVAIAELKLYRESRRIVDARLIVGKTPIKHKYVTLQYYDDDYGDWFDVFDAKTNKRGWVGVVCKKGYTCPETLQWVYDDGFATSDEFVLYDDADQIRAGDRPAHGHQFDPRGLVPATR